MIVSNINSPSLIKLCLAAFLIFWGFNYCANKYKPFLIQNLMRFVISERTDIQNKKYQMHTTIRRYGYSTVRLKAEIVCVWKSYNFYGARLRSLLAIST